MIKDGAQDHATTPQKARDREKPSLDIKDERGRKS